MNREQFRADRLDSMKTVSAALLPAAELFVSERDRDAFFAAISDAFIAQWNTDFGISDNARDAVNWFLDRIRPAVDKVVDVSDPRKIADWLGSAVVNGARAARAAADKDALEWTSRRDGKVRPMHVDADGQIKPVGEKFQVGGFELSFPGEPVGPPEVWISCRCVLAPATLTASAFAEHDLLFLTNRRTPKIVKRGERYQPTEAEGRISKRRHATEEEERTIARGDWVRVNERGEKPGDSGYMDKKSKVRPQLNSLEEKMSDMIVEPDDDTVDVEGVDDDMLDDPAVEDMEDPEDDDLDIVPDRIPWYSLMVSEKTRSGDGRSFSAGGVTWRDLPLPLRWQESDTGGHDGAVTIGTIENMWRDGNDIWASGWTVDSEAADRALGLHMEGGLNGISIDADDVELAADQEEGSVEFARGRISGATLVAIPAFDNVFFALGEPPMTRLEEKEITDGYGARTAEFKEYTPDERRILAEKEQALPDGSYPITDCEDLRNAIQAIGRASDPEKVKAHIRKRKEALGCPDIELPETWSVSLLAIEDGLPGFDAAPHVLSMGNGFQVVGIHARSDTAQVVEVAADARTHAAFAGQFGFDVVVDPSVGEAEAVAVNPAVTVRVKMAHPDLAWAKGGSVFTDRSGAGVELDDLLDGGVPVRASRVGGAAPTQAAVVLSAQSDKRMGDLPLAAFHRAGGVTLLFGDESRITVEAQTPVVRVAQTLRERGGIATVHSADGGTWLASAALGITSGTPTLVVGAAPAAIPGRLRASGDSASHNGSFARGPGWVTNPADTRRLHHFWVRGKGAAKVRWGTPGDFRRLRRHLAKYIEPAYLNRTVAQWHKDALGYWPGELGKPGNPPNTKENRRRAARHASSLSPALTLAAAAHPTVESWYFDDPQLDGPSPLIVDGDHVYGHLAAFGTCHIGIRNVCTEAPTSVHDYAYFRTGSVHTDKGRISVGQITMDTGHADLGKNARAAASHYDNTGTVVADVAAGEDQYGIWVSGKIRDTATDEQRYALAAGALSGDWRSIGGSLELVAALVVNVPGFPIPRPALAASAGEQGSLVAAGVVNLTDNGSDSTIRAASVEEIAEAVEKYREKKQARTASITMSKQIINAERISALRGQFE